MKEKQRSKTAIVMFAKAPIPSEVKTRLGKSITNRWSARFHAAFIADLSKTLSKLVFDSFLCFSGDEKHPAFDVCRTLGFQCIEQPDTDLGSRMSMIAEELFKTHDKVIIIGSDSPTLSPEHFEKTEELLDHNDVIIGPSFDGGYYLVGLRRDCFVKESEGSAHVLSVFQNINWSTRTVLTETLMRCTQEQHRCQLLGFWYDVDTVVDLQFMYEHLIFLRQNDPSFCFETHTLFEEFDISAI